MTRMDYDIQRCSKRCAVTNRELLPGEEFYSVLLRQGSGFVRRDYSVEAWTGPPEDAVGWWKSRLTNRGAPRRTWAPSDVMLEFFCQLESQPDQQDLRYVLALLMIRRGIFRQEGTESDDQGRSWLVVYSPHQEKEYQVAVVLPANDQRAQIIQQELGRLLQ